jgi:cytochrome d ubiquinol oxidase subunit I
MVGIGTALVLLGVWALGLRWRRRDYATARWFLRAASVAGFAAVAALEAGWIVTEVGRQPWVVFQILRTADAVTRAPGVETTFIAVVALYSALGIATLLALRALRRRWAAQDAAAGRAVAVTDGAAGDESIPYGPHRNSERDPSA